MKIVFLTEGGKEIGLGHLMRAISLSDAFSEKGIIPSIYVNGDESVADILYNKKYRIFNWIDNFGDIKNELCNADMAIIDSYKAPCELYEIISSSSKQSVYIDDYLRIKYPTGTIINCNLYAERLEYPNTGNQRILKGSQFALLRKEFWETPERHIRDNVESILITMGGSDIRKLTLPVYNSVKDLFNEIRISILISNAFSYKYYETLYEQDNLHIWHSQTSREIKDLMDDADLAISGAGQTLLELASTGVPTIVVGIIENQKFVIEAMAEETLFDFAGWYDDKNLFINICSKLNALRSRSIRYKKYQDLKKSVDGKGAQKIVHYLLEKC